LLKRLIRLNANQANRDADISLTRLLVTLENVSADSNLNSTSNPIPNRLKRTDTSNLKCLQIVYSKGYIVGQSVQ